MRQSVAPIVKDRELAFAAVGAALALILVNWIDVLASRRTGVQLFLIAGLAGAFWAYARTATRELADTTGVANEPVDAGEATVVKQESE
jgi:hypothetical protein